MLNFTYCNPVKIVFGRDTIPGTAALIPPDGSVMVLYGGGSIKTNGVYDQVSQALGSRRFIEFAGIEPNPAFEKLMQGVELARKEKVSFLLAVGGGSVIDGTKFIAAAVPFKGEDPWDMVLGKAPVENALPLGVVLTLPATGSEMNCIAVISRKSTTEKIGFSSPKLFPAFSVLDPAVTFSLPKKQVRNGIVDAFLHVIEQYMTVRPNSPLQDRQAEAIMLTLIEEWPKTLEDPADYESRSNLSWCATQALNGILSCGVPVDFSTHRIGHELSAVYGLDHAESLAIVLPALWKYKKEQKKAKLIQYAERIWGVRNGSDDAKVELAIEETVKFFHSLGMPTTLKDYSISADAGRRASEGLRRRGWMLGELKDISPGDVEAILGMCCPSE